MLLSVCILVGPNLSSKVNNFRVQRELIDSSMIDSSVIDSPVIDTTIISHNDNLVNSKKFNNFILNSNDLNSKLNDVADLSINQKNSFSVFNRTFINFIFKKNTSY